jgi:hypothetical protein
MDCMVYMPLTYPNLPSHNLLALFSSVVNLQAIFQKPWEEEREI